jgi:hypothetical protein
MANYFHRSSAKFVETRVLQTVISENAKQSTYALTAQKLFLNGSKANKAPFTNALVIPAPII